MCVCSAVCQPEYVTDISTDGLLCQLQYQCLLCAIVCSYNVWTTYRSMYMYDTPTFSITVPSDKCRLSILTVCPQSQGGSGPQAPVGGGGQQAQQKAKKIRKHFKWDADVK